MARYNMTPLPQQLEDKKKGCGVDIGGVPCGEFIAHTEDEDGREWGKTYYCKICQAEIAILEQAIAEMKKQRQEEIEFLQWIYSNNGVEEDFDNVMISIDNRINRLKEQQLNQPKTEE